MKRATLAAATIVIALAVFSFFIAGDDLAQAATQGALFPSSGTNDASVGSVSWSNPSRITADDTLRTSAFITSSLGYRDKDLYLMKSGGIVGGNKADTATNWGSEATITYGGSSDLWGTTWSPSEINDAGFGVWLTVSHTASGSTTNALKGSGYGFSIPAGASIDGIAVQIKRRSVPSPVQADVNFISVTVYYTGAVSSAVTSDAVIFE